MRSASIPKPSQDREGFDSSKSCGGKLSTAEQGALMSTVGLELTGVIDPYLNWKTASKHRQRSIRRPRTSFAVVIENKFTEKSFKESENIISKGPKRTGGGRKKSTANGLKHREVLIDKGPSRTSGNRKHTARRLKECQDLTIKEPKRSGDTPISEFEKLGVCILSQRFSDLLEFVPFKERGVQVVCSPLLPPQSPSYSNGSGNRADLGQERLTSDGNTNLKEINEGLCEFLDVSGISLLAAAACDSSMVDDFVNAEGSVHIGHPSEEEGIPMTAELCSLSEVKQETLFSTPGDSDVKVITVGSLDNVQSTENTSSWNNRFCLDLNTPMEIWENPVDEVVNAKSPAADVSVENGTCDEKMMVGIADAKHASALVYNSAQIFVSEQQFSCVPKDGVQEKAAFTCHSSSADHNEEKVCSLADDSDEVVCQMEDVPVAKIDDAEETELLYGPSCLARYAVGVERCCSLVNASNLEEEKADASPVFLGSTVETNTPCSHPILSENADIDGTAHASESLPGVDQRNTAAIPDENTYAVSGADPAISTGGCHLTKVETQTDLEISKMDQLITFGHLAEEASVVLVKRNSACKILTHPDVLSGEVSQHIVTLDHSTRGCGDNSKLVMGSCCSFTCRESLNHDELSPRSTSFDERGKTTMDMMVNKCFVLGGENSNAIKSDDPVHIGSNVSVCDSAVTMLGLIDAPSVDGALSSHETCKSYADSFTNSPGEVALEDHADCGYESHAYGAGTDRAIGAEKVELVSDDDSQYEDGEFRGSIINNWTEDEAEDGVTECVDYGSDNRYMDDVEAASLHFDNVECKNMGLSEVDYVLHSGAQFGKDAPDAVSQQFLRNPLIADACDAGCVKRCAGMLAKNGDGTRKSERNAKGALESAAGSLKAIGYAEFSKGSDGAWESFHSASLSSKSQRWDKWLEGRRISGDGVRDSGVIPVYRNQTAGGLDVSTVGKSLKSTEGSTRRKYLSSQTERSNSFDASNRKDKYYVKASRYEKDNEPNFKFEGAENGKSFTRARPMRMHRRGRGDHWVDSWNHRNPDSRDSPGHYNNAVTAIAAKLESNGFLIASDGTLLKAGSARPTDHVKRSVNASLQRTCHSVRRSPVERDGAFGMQQGLDNFREMSPNRFRTSRHGPGDRENYRTPVPYQQPYRRNKDFSPRRRPLHRFQSHSRSPSRSRSRSPLWTPSRKGSIRGMDRSLDLRQCSRSPYYMSEVIQERMRLRMREGMRSPRRSGFKHMVSHAASARNNTSPPHPSRWTDERNESLDQFWEYKHRRSPQRRTHAEHRFDLIDSQKRWNPDECYNPMLSGRFHESVNVGRELRHASNRNQRRDHG